MLNSDCLLWSRHTLNLILDTSPEQKSKIDKSGDLGGHSKATRRLIGHSLLSK